MRIHGLLFSTSILTAALASAQSQSPAPPRTSLPDAPTPSLFRNYLVPHDSRNELPRINPTAQPARQPLGKPNLVARNRSVCYTVRAYNFPTDNSADMTRPTGSTTCEAPKDGALKRSTVQIPR